MITTTIPEVDARAFRDAMGKFASGVTVVTGRHGSEPVGFTCQSFYSVSVDPMLVSFSVMKTSTTYPRIKETGRFAVNVLSHEQAAVSNQFARRGHDKWSSVAWEACGSGNPIIAETLMWVDCTIWAEYDAGDHYIVVGAVTELCPVDWHIGDPLLFFKGQYRHLREVEQAA